MTLEAQRSDAKHLLDELKQKPFDSSVGEEQQRECEDEIEILAASSKAF